MKKFLLAAAGAAALTAGAAMAGEGSTWSLSGTFGATSDYMFRGQTQTDHDFAVQGGLTLSHDSGFYVGAWASNVDFGNGTDYELDLYAGYGGALSDSTTFDLNATYYLYPDAPNGTSYDYVEIGGSLTYTAGAFSLYGKTALAPEFFGDTGFAAWVGTGLGYQVTEFMRLSGNVGYQWIEDNTLAGIPDYTNYDLGATFTLDVLSLDVRYFGTDLNKAECYGGTDLCSERVVGSATIGF